MNPVDVSVVIPTFHRERELREAIDSVLRQSDVAYEVIVVDDSADGSASAAVDSVHDPRVHYLRRPEPSGGRPAKPRNDGARHATGRYLVFLDDDDILDAGALALMVRTLDARPEAGMAFGVVVPFGADPADLRHHERYFSEARRIARRLRRPQDLGARLVYCPSILINSACIARRAVFTRVGGYDPEIPVCEDADLWARIAQATGFVFIDRPVVRYRTGAPSLMHSLMPRDEKLLASYRRIQRKYRQANGVVPALLMKTWARIALR